MDSKSYLSFGYDALEPQAQGRGESKEESLSLSIGISLKRIADFLERLPVHSGQQLGIFLEAAQREQERQSLQKSYPYPPGQSWHDRDLLDCGVESHD